ncbi:hypothetical protein MRY82_04605 [bacterium]|nr:hypothetical protein [bacterium]
MKINSSKSFRKQLIINNLKSFFAMVLCVLIAQCTNTKLAPTEDGGGSIVIPKINKVVAKSKESMTLVNAKATGYRSIEIELSHEIDQDAAANFDVYKIEAAKKGNPGAKNIKVIAVNVLEPKKLELTLSKRLLSMKYTLIINGLETSSAKLTSASHEIIPEGSRMIFVSEASSDGNLKNLMSPPSASEGYQVPNELCQAEASQHGLLGQYRALFLHPMLLEEQKDDYAFLDTMTDYVRADGVGQVKLSRTDGMLHPSFSLPIDVMANGQSVPYSFNGDGMAMQESFMAFTGFNLAYSDIEDEVCGEDENWNTANDYNVTGSLFRNKIPLFAFGASETCNCAKKARIICLQSASAIENSESAAWSPKEDGQNYTGDNYMFVSSVNVSANLGEALAALGGDASLSGLKAADAVCSNLVKEAANDTDNRLPEAARASFKKNYKHYIAVLSGQEDGKDKNAKDRFTPAAYKAGSYHLPNGVKLVDELKSFFDPKTVLQAPVTMTEQGSYLALKNERYSEDDYQNDDQMKEMIIHDVLSNLVFTGSNGSGELEKDATCNSWTSAQEDNIMTMGIALDSYLRLSLEGVKNSFLSSVTGLMSCSMELKLYCAYNKPKA